MKPNDGKPRIFARQQAGPWIADALCRGTDPEPFYPPRGDDAAVDAAKAVCAACPVRVECLDHAIDTNEHLGVWGGESANERRKIGRARRKARRLARIEAAA